jgi:hypothetical protein
MLAYGLLAIVGSGTAFGYLATDRLPQLGATRNVTASTSSDAASLY